MFVLLRSENHFARLTWTVTVIVATAAAAVLVFAAGRDALRVNQTPVGAKPTEYIGKESSERNSDSFYACPSDDLACANDPFGFEAIQLLHAQIDDDQNGNVDRDESNEFLRDDLKLQDGSTERADLHEGDDLISVQDLWKLWSKSSAYKWTVDDVVDWLTFHVELSQYAINFRINDVSGRLLPRLTSFSSHSLLSVIGIKNPVHRQKLALKAADVVLFGPPKNVPSVVKDFALVTSLFVTIFGCYFAYVQHRKSKCHLQKVMMDLKALQKAEDALSQLQHQLEKAQTEQQIVVSAKHDVERRLQMEIEISKAEAERLRMQREAMAKEQISCLKLAEDELTQLRKALGEAERQIQTRTSFISGDLQQWLQLTYEVETRYFEANRTETELQLKEAREMCDKIRRQKEKFLGSFQVAHTNSLDDTDNKIIHVRRALEGVKKDLQERSFRWKEIEYLCGFNIIINPGIPYLNSLLHRSRFFSCSGETFQHLTRQTGFFGIDDLNEDVPGTYLPQSSDSPGSDCQRVMSSPGYTNQQQVISNLMRAGMQLSVVGVNLSGMNSSQVLVRDTNPSPVSLPLHECKSTGSLSSIRSFASLQPFGRQCVFSLSAGDGSGGGALPLAAEAGNGNANNKLSNSNGFLCHGYDEFEKTSNNLWSASEMSSVSMDGDVASYFAASSTETVGRANEKPPESDDDDREAGLSMDFTERLSPENAKQKSKRPKKKMPFTKLLKVATNKEKSS